MPVHEVVECKLLLLSLQLNMMMMTTTTMMVVDVIE
jgi:hypothetical protein